MADTPSSRRPRQLLHPATGRPVHIAPNPSAIPPLRKQLSETHGDDAFDIHVRGSDEHIKALEECRAHHELRRRKLRDAQPGAFAEFENVCGELGALEAELDALESRRAVALDASFHRFGYSAHIRAIEDPDSASTPSRTSSSSARWESNSRERPMGSARRFWKRPAVRQYFHKGLIWRASSHTEVGAIELFVDLLYVGIIAVIGDRAAEEPTGEALLGFCVTFVLSWRLWSDLTMVMSWIEADDVVQRVCVLVFVACLVGFTTNIENAFSGSTYTELIAFYLAERLFYALYFVLIAFLIPMIRGVLVALVIMIMISSAFWIGSIHVAYPNQLALIWIAIVWDMFATSIIVAIVGASEHLQDTWMAPVAKHMQFYPALNIEHRAERMNAFVTLVIGYSVVALLYQSDAPAGINAFYGKAVLGLIIAFSFCLIYFEVDSTNLYVHAIRRHKFTYWIWQNVHLPFVLSFVLASGALAKLVVAHDCPNSAIEALAETSAANSVAELDVGLRWFFCGGIGVALVCTGLISLSHDHKDLPGLRFRKRYRLAIRFLCSVVIIVLPTAGDGLNSLDLIAVVTGMVVLSLFVELWGCSDCEQGSFWADRSSCRYAAECKLRKSDMEAFRNGEVTDIEQLMKRQRKDDKEKGEGIDIS